MTQRFAHPVPKELYIVVVFVKRISKKIVDFLCSAEHAIFKVLKNNQLISNGF